MAIFSRRTSRWLLGAAALVAAVILLAPMAGGQGFPFAFPVAPPGTPVGFIPVTADTRGNVIWGTAPDAGGIGPGTAGQILQTNATPAATWVTPSGDWTINSSAVDTVAKINGASVPAAGGLTTGNVLQVSGASALTYSPVNLAGGSNFVTGVLPTGNQASQSLAGDVTGTTAADTVVALTGSAGTTSLKSNLTPNADNVDTVGTSADRVASFSAGPTGFEVFHAASDANPVCQAGDSSGTGFASFGVGGATALDTRLFRNAAHDLQIDNGTNGAAQVEIGGTSATQVQILSTGTIDIPGVGASGGTGVSITLTPQGANATNGTGGNVVVSLAAPTGTGSEAGLVVKRGANQTEMLGTGSYSGATFGGLFLGPNINGSAGTYTILSDGTNTFINAPGASGEATIFANNGTELVEVNTSGIAPIVAGGASVGTSSIPWGAAFVGSSTTTNLGYTQFAAASGTHSTQDAIVLHAVNSARLSTYVAVNSISYTFGAAHHGFGYVCRAVGRVISAGSGGTCTFWGGVAADQTYRSNISGDFACSASGVCGFAGGGAFYLDADQSGGAVGSGVSPANLLFPFVGNSSGLTVTLAISLNAFGGACTTPPVVDTVMKCDFIDD